MDPAHFTQLRLTLHTDLARRLEDLAREQGESIESYIETILREKTGFTGPKWWVYQGQKPSRDED